MKFKLLFSLLGGIVISIVLFPANLFAEKSMPELVYPHVESEGDVPSDGETTEEEAIPVLRNENPSSTAYFSVTMGDGTREIVPVPPRTDMELPMDVQDVQFLYEEEAEVVMDQPVRTDRPVSYMEILDASPLSGEISWVDPLTDMQVEKPEPKPKDAEIQEIEKEDIRKKQKVDTKEDQPDRMMIINEGENITPIYVMTQTKKGQMLVLMPRQKVYLPPGTEQIKLHFRQMVRRRGQIQEPPLIRIIKPEGDAQDITEIGKWVSVI